MNICQQTINGIQSVNTNSLTLDSIALIENAEFLALNGIDTTQTIQYQIDNIIAGGSVGPAGPAGPAGTAGMIWQSTYNHLLAYAVNDVVYYFGSSYICTVAQATLGNYPDSFIGWNLVAQKGDQGIQGNQGIQGIQGSQGNQGIQGNQGNEGPVGPIGMSWQGDWDMETIYALNDGVYSPFGSSFISLQDNNQDNVPIEGENTSYWSLFASKGNPGIKGDPGDKGNTGDKGNNGDKGNTGPAGGLDPVELAALSAVVIAAAINTTKTINILVPPATFLGVTTMDGILNLAGAMNAGELNAPVADLALINGCEAINSVTGLVEIDGIQVVGQSNLSNTNITSATINNLTCIPVGETHDLLTLNPTQRALVMYDGEDGHPIFQVNTRLPDIGVEADNTIDFDCQTNLNFTSLVGKPMIFKALGDEFSFGGIDPEERRFEFFGAGGLSDLIYDSNLRQTIWLDKDNYEVFKISTRGEYPAPNSAVNNAWQCLMNNVVIGSLTAPICENIAMNAQEIDIGFQASACNIGLAATLTSLGDNNATTTSTTKNVSLGTYMNSVVVAFETNILKMGENGDEIDIGLNSNQLNIGESAVGVVIGKQATQVIIGEQSSQVSMGLNCVQTNVAKYTNSAITSTTNIGENTTLGTPNYINIGTGVTRSNIIIGSDIDINQETTIHGKVTFTGEVNVTSGGNPMTLGDYINQLI